MQKKFSNEDTEIIVLDRPKLKKELIISILFNYGVKEDCTGTFEEVLFPFPSCPEALSPQQ